MSEITTDEDRTPYDFSTGARFDPGSTGELEVKIGDKITQRTAAGSRQNQDSHLRRLPNGGFDLGPSDRPWFRDKTAPPKHKTASRTKAKRAKRKENKRRRRQKRSKR